MLRRNACLPNGRAINPLVHSRMLSRQGLQAKKQDGGSSGASPEEVVARLLLASSLLVAPTAAAQAQDTPPAPSSQLQTGFTATSSSTSSDQSAPQLNKTSLPSTSFATSQRSSSTGLTRSGAEEGVGAASAAVEWEGGLEELLNSLEDAVAEEVPYFGALDDAEGILAGGERSRAASGEQAASEVALSRSAASSASGAAPRSSGGSALNMLLEWVNSVDESEAESPFPKASSLRNQGPAASAPAVQADSSGPSAPRSQADSLYNSLKASWTGAFSPAPEDPKAVEVDAPAAPFIPSWDEASVKVDAPAPAIKVDAPAAPFIPSWVEAFKRPAQEASQAQLRKGASEEAASSQVNALESTASSLAAAFYPTNIGGTASAAATSRGGGFGSLFDAFSGAIRTEDGELSSQRAQEAGALSSQRSHAAGESSKGPTELDAAAAAVAAAAEAGVTGMLSVALVGATVSTITNAARVMLAESAPLSKLEDFRPLSGPKYSTRSLKVKPPDSMKQRKQETLLDKVQTLLPWAEAPSATDTIFNYKGTYEEPSWQPSNATLVGLAGVGILSVFMALNSSIVEVGGLQAPEGEDSKREAVETDPSAWGFNNVYQVAQSTRSPSSTDTSSLKASGADTNQQAARANTAATASFLDSFQPSAADAQQQPSKPSAPATTPLYNFLMSPKDSGSNAKQQVPTGSDAKQRASAADKATTTPFYSFSLPQKESASDAYQQTLPASDAKQQASTADKAATALFYNFSPSLNDPESDDAEQQTPTRSDPKQQAFIDPKQQASTARVSVSAPSLNFLSSSAESAEAADDATADADVELSVMGELQKSLVAVELLFGSSQEVVEDVSPSMPLLAAQNPQQSDSSAVMSSQSNSFEEGAKEWLDDSAARARRLDSLSELPPEGVSPLVKAAFPIGTAGSIILGLLALERTAGGRSNRMASASRVMELWEEVPDRLVGADVSIAELAAMAGVPEELMPESGTTIPAEEFERILSQLDHVIGEATTLISRLDEAQESLSSLEKSLHEKYT